MSLETYQKIVDKVLINSNQPSINFLFHGGEPSLINNSWYEMALNYTLNLGKVYSKKIVFSMQTNLISLPDSKIELFKKYEIQLGISLDGTFEEATNQRGAEKQVIHNYKKLVSNRISVGVLTTINVDNYNKFDSICHFLEQLEVKSFKANVVYNVGRGLNNSVLTTSNVIQAQQTILKYMIDTRGTKVVEQNTLLELKRFFNKHTGGSLCHDHVCGAGKLAMGITTSGDILPCGRFQWDESQYYLGQIDEQENDYFDKLNRFQQQEPENWLNCKSCSASKICRYSCQAFIVRSKEKINQECKPTIAKYQFFVEHQEELQDVLQNVEVMQSEKVVFNIKTPSGIKSYPFNQQGQSIDI